VIFDFGIAKVGSGESTRITFTGLLGSFDYIAPEQIQASEDVDRRADVYSLGVMAFRTLTGQLPFGYRNAAAMLMAHLQQQPPNPRQKNPKLSTSTAEVILKALAKQPENRYASAGEFFEALKYTWVTGE
jgi:serine/threonine-protein kinase